MKVKTQFSSTWGFEFLNFGDYQQKRKLAIKQLKLDIPSPPLKIQIKNITIYFN